VSAIAAAVTPKWCSLAREVQVEKRAAEVLRTYYFHVVCAVCEQIASVAYQNKEVVYDILFRATVETLSIIAADPIIWEPRSASLPYSIAGEQNLLFLPISNMSVRGTRNLF
jgi:hypothetical protein